MLSVRVVVRSTARVLTTKKRIPAEDLAAVLAPWTWRNYEHFGAVFFIRDNMGMELQVSEALLG